MLIDGLAIGRQSSSDNQQSKSTIRNPQSVNRQPSIPNRQSFPSGNASAVLSPPMPFWRLPAAVVIAVCSIVPAHAQETRAEALERERAEKSRQLKPYDAGKIEKWLLWYERNNPLARIAPYNGFYVQYGFTDRPTGAGIAVGGGWRHDLFARNARVEFEVGQSLRNYRLLRADFSLPRLLDERLEVGLDVRHSNQPQEDFYGLGIDSLEEDRSTFTYKAPEVQGRAVFSPARWFRTGVRVGWTDVSISSGKDKRFPSTEELFTSATAPGLDDDPSFGYTDLFSIVDTRDQPGNTRSGGYYGVLWRRYIDTDLDKYLIRSGRRRPPAIRTDLRQETCACGAAAAADDDRGRRQRGAVLLSASARRKPHPSQLRRVPVSATAT